MNLIPLQDNVLVKIDEKMDRTATGLYLPDNSDKPRMTGVVLGVGDDVKNIKTGDKVYVTYKDAFATSIPDVWFFPAKNILALVK